MHDSPKKEENKLLNIERNKGSSHKSFIHQFPRNLGSNILLFLTNVLIGIWLVPYLIKNLGVAAYGLIPLVMSLTHYVGLVTVAISGGISRFLTIDLQRGNYDQANKTFNTSFWSLLIVILLLVPVLVVSTFFLPVFFQVPSGQETSFKWLFAGTIGAFLLTTLSSCFSASTVAYNRLDLRNYSHIVRSVSRIIFLVLLFNVFEPSLERVALATLFSSFASFGMNYFYWRKLTPNLEIRPSSFDKKRVRDLTQLGGWILVNQIGSLLFLQIDLIVVNRFWGPTAGGEYASILQWSMLLRSMAAVLSGVIQPMLMISYARGNMENLVRISKTAVKFMGLGMSIPIGFACGFSEELLNVWLGPDFIKFSPLLILVLFHLSINLAVTPLFSINLCYNKVKFPGIITLILGGLNVMLAIVIPVVFDIGVYGVALAGAIVLTLKNALFTPWYAARVVGIRPQAFLKEIGVSVVSTGAIFILCTFLSNFLVIDSWLQLILTGSLVAASFLSFAFFVVISPAERLLLRNLVLRRS